MNPREIEIKTIANEFANWEIKISNLNSLNLYDANIFSEHSVCELLNCIYDYQLININTLQKNFPAIDLADSYNRVSFQITSTNSSKKIQSTIDKFIENDLHQAYDELFILILGKKQKSYTDFELSGGFEFNKNRNIIDFRDLLNFISQLPVSKLKKISRILIDENRVERKPNFKVNSVARLKRNLALKKRMQRDLLLKLEPQHWRNAIYEPWIKFRYSNAIIRSVNDKTFPNADESKSRVISPWFKGEFWDFYDNGIEFISQGGKAIFDNNGNWDILKWNDEIENNPDYKIVHYNPFYRIPYDFIVECDMDTDPYYGLPTIYVEYKKDGMPYEEMLYGQAGSIQERSITRYFDNEKRKILK